MLGHRETCLQGGEVCLEVAGRVPPGPCSRPCGEVERGEET